MSKLDVQAQSMICISLANVPLLEREEAFSKLRASGLDAEDEASLRAHLTDTAEPTKSIYADAAAVDEVDQAATAWETLDSLRGVAERVPSQVRAVIGQT